MFHRYGSSQKVPVKQSIQDHLFNFTEIQNSSNGKIKVSQHLSWAMQ